MRISRIVEDENDAQLQSWDVTARRDFFLGVGLIVLFLFIFFWVIPTQIPAIVAHPLAHALAPSFLPSIMSLIIVILGCLIAVHAWRNSMAPAFDPSSSSGSGDGASTDWQRAAIIRAVAALVAAFGYCVVFDALGALLSAVLITIFLIMLTGERSARTVLVAGVLVPTLIYVIFTRLAAAPLPRGILPF